MASKARQLWHKWYIPFAAGVVLALAVDHWARPDSWLLLALVIVVVGAAVFLRWLTFRKVRANVANRPDRPNRLIRSAGRGASNDG